MQGSILPHEALSGARLSIAEMLLGGTTTFLESLWAERYGFGNLVKAVEESGIRGCLGKVVMDVNPDQPAFRNRMHKGLVEGPETLPNAIKMWEQYDGVADGRVKVWFGARTPGGVSTSFLERMCKEAKERGIHITMHCLEEKMDHDVFKQFGKSPMEYCDSIGLLSDRTVLIHMCWVEGEDIKLLAKTGTHIAHCPASNMKLASGFCPVPEVRLLFSLSHISSHTKILTSQTATPRKRKRRHRRRRRPLQQHPRPLRGNASLRPNPQRAYPQPIRRLRRASPRNGHHKRRQSPRPLLRNRKPGNRQESRFRRHRVKESASDSEL